MSGTPDWKPGCTARPSCSASNRKLGRMAPSSIKVSPSSIDLSGRHGGDWSGKRSRTHTAEDDRLDRQAASSKRPRTGGSIFGGGTKVYVRSTPSTVAIAPVAPQWTRSHPFAVQVAPQAMCPGGMFEPGWHIGAWFRCNLRPGFHNVSMMALQMELRESGLDQRRSMSTSQGHIRSGHYSAAIHFQLFNSRHQLS